MNADTIKAVAAVLEAKGDFKVINRIEADGSESSYLKRFYLVRTPEYAVYIHQFFDSDRDPWLHDHPWDSGNLVVAGGYHEEIFNEDGEREMFWRAPGYVCQRRTAETYHRVIIPDDKPGDVWTLFWRWNRRREWGFLVDNKNWVKSDEYLELVNG